MDTDAVKQAQARVTRLQADADNMFDMAEIRARSRDSDRNEALARATNDTATVNAIGEGLMPVPQVDWRVLGRTRAWADAWNQEVRAIARDYYESTDVDASRQGGWGELQQLAFRNVLMSGSVLGLLTWRPDDCEKWATAVHLIEGDRLSNPGGTMDDRFLRGGVEIDAYGKPVAYHIQHDHPGEAYLGGQTYVWARVPARTSWGRPRVMHVFERERPGQNYGMALCATDTLGTLLVTAVGAQSGAVTALQVEDASTGKAWTLTASIAARFNLGDSMLYTGSDAVTLCNVSTPSYPDAMAQSGSAFGYNVTYKVDPTLFFDTDLTPWLMALGQPAVPVYATGLPGSRATASACCSTRRAGRGRSAASCSRRSRCCSGCAP